MFGVNVQGRLGNQMFIYAFALAHAQRVDAELFFHRPWRWLLPRYFEVDARNFVGCYSKCAHFFAHHGGFPPRITQDQTLAPRDTLALVSRDDVLIRGYFQSEDYFASARDVVKSELRVRDCWRLAVREITGNDRPNVVVHIRRTDYVRFGGGDTGFNLALPADYYRDALARIDTRGKNVVFVGDDVDFARRNLACDRAVFVTGTSEIADLQILMQADELVISNSTFAWWGAYLNSRAPRVHSPLHWLGFKVQREFPNGVTRAEWAPLRVAA